MHSYTDWPEKTSPLRKRYILKNSWVKLTKIYIGQKCPMGKRFAKKLCNYHNCNENGRESRKKSIFSENTKREESVAWPIFHWVLSRDLNPFDFTCTLCRTANGHDYVKISMQRKNLTSQITFNFKRKNNENQQISAKPQRNTFFSVVVLNRKDKNQSNKLEFGYGKYWFICSNRF